MRIYIDIPSESTQTYKIPLVTYLNHVNAEMGRRFRSAIIICPGGAYAFRSATEGEAVAIKYQACGMQAFVLEYSVNVAFPSALVELAASVKYIRDNADALDVDPNRVFVCGFSAGGHLAASLATLWNSDILKPYFPDVNIIKPSGAILCYPVITTGKFAQRETIDNVSGNLSGLAQERLSLEKQVSSDMPPVFIWHTLEDDLVPVENTLLFVKALREFGASFELHIFPHGRHGLALATECTAVSEDHINHSVAQWFDLSTVWLKERQ